MAASEASGLRSLQLPLLAVAAAAALAAAAVWYTHRILLAAQKKVIAQQAALSAATQQYQKADEEKQIIVSHRPRYQQLQQAGFIGPENRINWLDALREVNQELKLFGVDYSVEAQRPSQLGLETGDFQLLESEMTLRMGLLHEGDLSRFLAALEARRVGVFVPHECTLTRVSAGGFAAIVRPNLTAECKLAWLTVQEKNRPQP